MDFDLIDYANPLQRIDYAERRCFDALEEDKDLDAAEQQVRKIIDGARDVLAYIKLERQRRGA